MVLTTKLTNLEKQLSEIDKGTKDKSIAGTGKDLSQPRSGSCFTLDEWYIKKEGGTKTIDGETWYWCPHHKMEGTYDGVYVKHPKDKHDKWFERKNKFKRKDISSSDAPPYNSLKSQKLALSNNTKAAMVANFHTQEQADIL